MTAHKKRRSAKATPAKHKKKAAQSPRGILPQQILNTAIGAALCILAIICFVAGTRYMLANHYTASTRENYIAGNKDFNIESNLLKAIRLFPDYGNAHQLLGSFYRQAGRHEEARQHLEQALKTATHPASAWHSLGEVALHSDAVTGADGVAAFEHGLLMAPRPDPEPAYVWYEAGILALNNNMPAKAAVFLTRSENLVVDLEQDVALAKAAAYFNLGLFETSMMSILKQLVRTPGLTQATNQLLQQCRDANRFDLGLFIVNAVMKCVDKTSALLTTGVALAFLAGENEYDRAIDWADEALALDENLVSPHYFLGEIYRAREEWEKAARHYERYIEASSPDDPQVKAIQDRLKEIKERSSS